MSSLVIFEKPSSILSTDVVNSHFMGPKFKQSSFAQQFKQNIFDFSHGH